MEEIQTTEETKMYLTENSKSFLKETAKWAYFLSIMGFIGIALLVLLALFMGTLFAKLGSLGGGVAAMGALGGGFITTIYLVFAVIYFFPVYYLYQFASKAKADQRNPVAAQGPDRQGSDCAHAGAAGYGRHSRAAQAPQGPAP